MLYLSTSGTIRLNLGIGILEYNCLGMTCAPHLNAKEGAYWYFGNGEEFDVGVDESAVIRPLRRLCHAAAQCRPRVEIDSECANGVSF